jgi:hypothetical protein
VDSSESAIGWQKSCIKIQGPVSRLASSRQKLRAPSKTRSLKEYKKFSRAVRGFFVVGSVPALWKTQFRAMLCSRIEKQTPTSRVSQGRSPPCFTFTSRVISRYKRPRCLHNFLASYESRRLLSASHLMRRESRCQGGFSKR